MSGNNELNYPTVITMSRKCKKTHCLALVIGKNFKHMIRSKRVILGRKVNSDQLNPMYKHDKEKFEIFDFENIQIESNQISRKQMEFQVENGIWQLKNLGKNVFHMNGREVQPNNFIEVNKNFNNKINVCNIEFIFKCK